MFMANYSSVSQSYHAGGHGFHAGAESPGCDVGLAKMCDTSKPQLGGEHASFGVHSQGRQREKSSGGGRRVGLFRREDGEAATEECDHTGGSFGAAAV